jgi:hypothetical protein
LISSFDQFHEFIHFFISKVSNFLGSSNCGVTLDLSFYHESNIYCLSSKD